MKLGPCKLAVLPPSMSSNVLWPERKQTISRVERELSKYAFADSPGHLLSDRGKLRGFYMQHKHNDPYKLVLTNCSRLGRRNLIIHRLLSILLPDLLKS